MRRKTRVVTHARRRAFVYGCALVALVVYGLPRIPALQRGLPGTFSLIWILFAGLALAANVYFLVGADKERSRMLELRTSGTSAGSTVEDINSAAPNVRRRAH